MRRINSILLASVIVFAMYVTCAYADLYVISTSSNGGVAQFDKYGTRVRTLPATYGTQLSFGPDGDLYVMSSRNGGKVVRYNSITGVSKGDFFAANSTDWVTGLAFGCDGDLYVAYKTVAGVGRKRVAHIAGPLKQNAGAVLSPIIDSTGNPNYLGFGPDGDLFVSDISTNSIQRWYGPPIANTSKGTYVSSLTGVPVFGPDGNLYVGKKRYQGPSGSTPGALIDTFIDLTGSGLSAVNAVAFDYVSGDLYAHDGIKVARFAGPGKANQGKFVSALCTLGLSSAGAMVFTPAKEIPADPAAGLYVTSTNWNGKGVFQYSTAGTQVKSFPNVVEGTQLAFGPDGDLYALASGFAGHITRYNSVTGLYKGEIFTANPDDYLFGMTFGRDGDLYVSYTCVGGDWGRRQVAHISGPTKSDLFSIKSPLIDKWPLYGPFTMTFGPDGDLYISDGDLYSIQHWGGPNQPNTYKGDFISGVTGISAFGSDGNLYVGINRYQGPFGANPGSSMGQFINLTGSGMSTVKCVAFNPADGDLYAHDGVVVSRFAGPGKYNQGSFISLFANFVTASTSDIDVAEPRQMIFAPTHVVPIVYPIKDIRALEDGTKLIIENALVSAVFYGDGAQRIGFSIESSDRLVGMRVISSQALSPGDSVELQGVITTVSGERVIDATAGYVTIRSSGNPTPSPFGIQNKSLAGGAFGAQAGVADNASVSPVVMSNGCNNVGLLVKTWGIVKKAVGDSTFGGYFYIDDGAGLNDGSGEIGIRCRPAPNAQGLAAPLPLEGAFVIVTGLSGVTQINSNNVRYVWTTICQSIVSQ